MRPLSWIKKHSSIIILPSQVTGLTAIALLGVAVFILALITYGERNDPRAELAIRQIPPGPVAVELVRDTDIPAVYFLPSGTTLTAFLASQGIMAKGTPMGGNQPLERGMKIRVTKEGIIGWGDMEATKKLALGIPLDVNSATLDDLLLVPGIGEKTAQAIIAFREKQGRHLHRLEELLAVPGIKEKRLQALKDYLTCCEPREGWGKDAR